MEDLELCAYDDIGQAVEVGADGGGNSGGAVPPPLPQPVPPDEHGRHVSSPQTPEGAPSPPPADAADPWEAELLRLPGMEGVEPGPRDADALRSMRMQELYLKDLPPEWVKRLIELRTRFKRWEIAALIIWSSLPKDVRKPKTMKDLAVSVFRVGAKQITQWLHSPGVEEAIMETRLAALMDYVPGAIRALGELAEKEDYRCVPAQRLLFEMTGIYTPKADIGVGPPKWVTEAAGKVKQTGMDKLEGLAQIPAEDVKDAGDE